MRNHLTVTGGRTVPPQCMRDRPPPLFGRVPDEELIATLMRELRTMHPDAPEPSAHVIARLGDFPFQRGAFSYMPTGASEELRRQLAGEIGTR